MPIELSTLFVTYLTINTNRSLTNTTREDIEAFVEHEQDRRLKLSTVRSKLVTLRAFLRFLIEQGYVDHEVLTRKIQIKLPESLPRVIAPSDVKQLPSVVTRVRDRALVSTAVADRDADWRAVRYED